MKEAKILVTGANGQIGSVLCQSLRKKFGQNNVIASDIKKGDTDNQPFVFLDILNHFRLKEILGDHGITQIYHLAAILSASGEWKPLKTWNINLNGLLTILEIAYELGIEKVFFPSTIGVFGVTTPREMTAQDVPLLPTTVYGMSKATGELWCNYYYQKYNLDVRCVRYPGILGYQTIPSGGTTDYAVEIFYEAIKHGQYDCFLKSDTRLPMMYMPDAIRGTIELMQAPRESIKLRYGYNLASMSFTPEEIALEIKEHIPDFSIHYNPDFRQEIAESWPRSIDDSMSRLHWGWKPDYDLKATTAHMIMKLYEKLKK